MAEQVTKVDRRPARSRLGELGEKTLDLIVEAERPWQPIGRIFAGVLGLFGTGIALFVSNAAWWIHNLVVLLFLNLLPLSKHFHIITGLPNVFFRNLEPTGALSKMDLENSERFGTSRIDQFSWKQVLDMYSCTECGRCASQCPATASVKPSTGRFTVTR